MSDNTGQTASPLSGLVYALGEKPIFHPGDHIRISARSPIGHCRVPLYLRGKKSSGRS